MNRLSTDFFDAFGLGFDDLARRLKEGIATYPPYNIVKTGENTYMVEMAVAGFTEKDIELVVTGNVLSVFGEMSGDQDAEYLHKGIASRPFTHKFTLAEKVEVSKVDLENGILSIFLRKNVPDDERPKRVPINGKTEKSFLRE